MCRNAIIHHRDGSATVCRCQADLHEAMPRGVWFFPPAGEPDLEEDGFEPGVCLCPVDLDRTARENGYRRSRYAPDGSEDVFDDHLYLDCDWRTPTNVCANGKRPQGYCDIVREGFPLTHAFCRWYLPRRTPSASPPPLPRPKPLISAICTVVTDVIVRETLDPLIAYVEEQGDLPVGYRQAIRGYWLAKYDSVELRNRFDAIDGAAAFCRYGGEFFSRDETPGEDGRCQNS